MLRNYEIIPVDPAGDCCYESSTKPCKSEGSSEHRRNAQQHVNNLPLGLAYPRETEVKTG